MNRIIRAAILLLGLVWVALVSVAAAEGLPNAKPEEVGFSSERLGRVTEMLRTNIAAGEIPGAVLLIARHGKIAYFESLGLLDPQTKTPMSKDAIFRIYSMSKPITSAAAMMLFEEAKFTLNEPRVARVCSRRQSTMLDFCKCSWTAVQPMGNEFSGQKRSHT
jgi:CubicO group peptidase (beta-lactamase class C family)